MAENGSITQLLQEWREGRAEALDSLLPYIYDELHQLASSYLRREQSGHTLQPTALVHELYLKLAGARPPDVAGRRHFYGIAARLMRQILVDHARRNLAEKRGGAATPLSLEESFAYSIDRAAEFTALDEALALLARINERAARVIELRFFTGLSVEETAALLSVSDVSVYRDQRFAIAFLSDQLKSA